MPGERKETAVNGGEIRDLTVNGNGTAAWGIVMQTYEGRIDNVAVNNVTNNGIDFRPQGFIGSLTLPNGASNNRVTNCVIYNCGNAGIATSETSVSDVFTDGYLSGNIISNCGTGVYLGQATDWQIVSNHIYTVQFNGMTLGDMWNCHVISNAIEQWGQTARAGTYRAIDGALIPSYGGMSTIVGNVIDVQVPPGNSGSAIEGIHVATRPAVTGWFTATGNNFWCDVPAAGFSTASPLIVENTASTSTTVVVSTGNQVAGNWTHSTWVQIPDGGTIHLTTGI